MIQKDDIVVSRNPQLPMRMTVVSVNERDELAFCVFSYSGRRAGAFFFSDLIKLPNDHVVPRVE